MLPSHLAVQPWHSQRIIAILWIWQDLGCFLGCEWGASSSVGLIRQGHLEDRGIWKSMEWGKQSMV